MDIKTRDGRDQFSLVVYGWAKDESRHFPTVLVGARLGGDMSLDFCLSPEDARTLADKIRKAADEAEALDEVAA